MTLPPIFTPQYYAHWRDFEARHWWTAGMRDVASLLIELAQVPLTGTLLDVGCGSGQGMAWWTRTHPGWGAIGVDPGWEGLRAAADAGFGSVASGSAIALPVRTGAVDLVITLDVLQHLPLNGGDRAALREMHRVLRPGGHLYLRTNAQSYPRVPDDVEAVWHKYEPDELREKLTEAGFRILRLSRVNALLGLAEIPGALRTRRAGHQRHTSYDVVSKPVRAAGRWSRSLKRGWLRLEGRAVRAGVTLPFGRSIVALCCRD